MSTTRRLPQALDDGLMAKLAGEGPTPATAEPFDREQLRRHGRAAIHADAYLVSAAVHVAVLLLLSISLLSADVTDVCTLLAQLSIPLEETPLETLTPGPGLAAEMKFEPEATIPPEISSLPEEFADSDSLAPDPDTVLWASGFRPPTAPHSEPLPAGKPGGHRARAAAAPGDGGKGEGPRLAEYFGTVAYGDCFVYILDMSGSMAEPKNRPNQRTRFDRAVAELLYSLERLNPDQQFYVVLFSNDMRRMLDETGEARMLPATRESRQRLKDWIVSIRPAGGTKPREAIRFAISLRPSAIFILSDGAFTGFNAASRGGMFHAAPQIDQLIDRGNREQVPMHSFAFEDPQAKANMEALASLTGGRYRYIEPVTPQKSRGQPGQAAAAVAQGPLAPAERAAELLDLGDNLCHAGQEEEALDTYRELIRRYPFTSAAAAAYEQIGQITTRAETRSWNGR